MTKNLDLFYDILIFFRCTCIYTWLHISVIDHSESCTKNVNTKRICCVKRFCEMLSDVEQYYSLYFVSHDYTLASESPSASHTAPVCCSQTVCWLSNCSSSCTFVQVLALFNAKIRLSVATAQLCLPKPPLPSECSGKDPAASGSHRSGLRCSPWQVQFTLSFRSGSLFILNEIGYN